MQLVFFPVHAAAEEAVILRELRFGVDGDALRVVLDVEAPVDYRVFVLSDPVRVVMDAVGARWRMGSGYAGVGAGFIARYRYGQYRRGLARLVLDCEAPVRIRRVFSLPPGEGEDGVREDKGHRIVLDLVRADASAFLAQLRAPPLLSRPGLVIAARPPPEAAVRKRSGALPLVVIDAGHGGVDPGALSVTGAAEKNIVIEAALSLRGLLEESGRYRVALTREEDVFLPLRLRTGIAHRAGADVFISLHADSISTPDIRGLSVYTLSEQASDEEAAALARHENKSDLISGVNLDHEPPEVAHILIDLTQRESMNHSARLAQFLLRGLRRQARLLPRPHRFAGFTVLKALDIPSVLIELGYLSNPHEEALLRNPAYRRRLLSAIAVGIDEYFIWRGSASR